MRPTLIKLFDLEFHAYATFLSIAFLVCTFSTVRTLHRRIPPVWIMPDAGLWTFVGALFGAKIWWILQYDQPRHLLYAFMLWKGGLVFYGGLLGGLLGLWSYLRLHQLPILPVADAAAPFLALGEAITRIGCFLNGCCWGRPTTAPWGVCFPAGSHPYAQQLHDGLIKLGAAQSIPIHPTQLYMVIGLILTFVILRFVYHQQKTTGLTMGGYLLGYGILRFTVEGFRGDSVRSVAGMTVSQSISMGLVLLAGIVIFISLSGVYRSKKDRPAIKKQEAEH